MSIIQVVHSESDRELRPVVGFVGIGRMGKRMAANILKAGYNLVVWSRTLAHARELESLGASVASCPKNVAEKSSIVITMLADPKSAREVFSGKNGLIEGIAAQTDIHRHDDKLAVTLQKSG